MILKLFFLRILDSLLVFFCTSGEFLYMDLDLLWDMTMAFYVVKLEALNMYKLLCFLCVLEAFY